MAKTEVRQILNESIINEDISPSAGISVSKLSGSASTIVGQKATGGIVNLTPAEAKAILSLSNVVDKDTSSMTFFSNIVVSGELKVASGDTDYICPVLVSVPTGFTLTLKNMRYRINGGTSLTFKLQKNGADLSGYGTTASPKTCNTSTAETVSDASLADNDQLNLVVIAVTSSPLNLTCRLEFLLTKS